MRKDTTELAMGLAILSVWRNLGLKRLSLSAIALLSISIWGCSKQVNLNSAVQQILTATSTAQPGSELSYSPIEPHVIELSGSPSDEKLGGIIAADVNDDGQKDFVISQPGSIQVYSYSGQELWSHDAQLNLSGKSEEEGLPGLHGAGVQVGDVDGDGKAELLYVTNNNKLEILEGATGNLKYSIELPSVESKFNRWEHAIIANFQGQGDTDLLLQASRNVSDRDNYIRDNIQAAFSIQSLIASGSSARPLWQQTDFVSASHGPARVVDLNGDGQDEVIGGTILGADGRQLHDIGISNRGFPHIDSIAIGDIDPDRPGLEVVIPEEHGRKRIILYDETGTIWESDHRQSSFDDDGDKVAIGNFDPSRPGLEMWFRGNNSEHFTVLDARGDVIADYQINDRKPKTWTNRGFEVIHSIHWTGDGQQHIVAKERHKAGDVGIFDAMTGQAIALFPAAVDRLYVADVVGDWREEIITIEGTTLKIYQNPETNPSPDRASLWEQAHYRRQKMTWNYYSP